MNWDMIVFGTMAGILAIALLTFIYQLLKPPTAEDKANIERQRRQEEGTYQPINTGANMLSDISYRHINNNIFNNNNMP